MPGQVEGPGRFPPRPRSYASLGDVPPNELPPKSPEVRRRFVLKGAQLGMPLLLLVPVLALAGVFDARGEWQASSPGLSVSANGPSRTRATLDESLDIRVRNTSDGRFEDVRVRLDPAWQESLLRVSFLRPPGMDHWVSLGSLAPGEEGRVRVDFQVERLGKLTGAVEVEAGGVEPVRLPLEMFVFP